MLAAVLSLLATGDYLPVMRAYLGEEDSPLVARVLTMRARLAQLAHE